LEDKATGLRTGAGSDKGRPQEEEKKEEEEEEEDTGTQRVIQFALAHAPWRIWTLRADQTRRAVQHSRNRP